MKLASSLSGAGKLQVPTRSKLQSASSTSGGKLGGLRKPGGLGAKKLGVTKLSTKLSAKPTMASKGDGDMAFEDIEVTVERGKKAAAEGSGEEKKKQIGSKYGNMQGGGEVPALGISAKDR